MADATMNRSRSFTGTALSRGVGIGPVFCLERSSDRSFRRISDDQIASELERLRKAIDASLNEIDEISNPRATHDTSSEVNAIFDVQRLLLTSPSFTGAIEDAIKIRSIDAASAVEDIRLRHRDRSRRVSDERFAEKQLDLDDVATRLLSHLVEGSNRSDKIDLNGKVLVCETLRPLDLIGHRDRPPIAIVTKHGGWTSHASIVARQFNIPMVTGIDPTACRIEDGTILRVDGNTASVAIVRDDDRDDRSYNAIVPSKNIHAKTTLESDGKVTTTDGCEVTIWCNHDVSLISNEAFECGAGIGLFRSELMITDNGKLPSRSEQIDIYTSVSDHMGGRPVNIRTFDLDAHELPDRSIETEQNPALGLRGIRSSLRFPEIFREQIRAILKANANGNLRIVLPMISSANEIATAKSIIDAEFAQLPNAVRPLVGVMIEVPSAVLISDLLAEEVDFFCLGTNDLVQYMLASDRDNDLVSEYYNSLDPSLLRAIEMVVNAAKKKGVRLIACGEMASSRFYIPILIGLGIREISIRSNDIETTAELVNRLDTTSINTVIEKAKMTASSKAIESIFQDHYRSELPDLVDMMTPS